MNHGYFTVHTMADDAMLRGRRRVFDAEMLSAPVRQAKKRGFARILR
ncbi:hypothetical protein [Mariprofundus ferrooxydans]|nr:hypothetical protein [Mariprofundus ferrooxydans]